MGEKTAVTNETLQFVTDVVDKKIKELQTAQYNLQQSVNTLQKKKDQLIEETHNLVAKNVEAKKASEQKIAKIEGNVEQMQEQTRESLDQAKAKEGQTEALRQEGLRNKKLHETSVQSFNKERAKFKAQESLLEQKLDKLQEIKRIAEAF